MRCSDGSVSSWWFCRFVLRCVFVSVISDEFHLSWLSCCVFPFSAVRVPTLHQLALGSLLFFSLVFFLCLCFFHLSIPFWPWTCVRGIYFWLNRLYFLWFWTMSSCVLWCEPRTFKHAWICADIRNIRKHKHNARQCKCFRTETCYMRKLNVDTTDVIVSLQTCLSHNDESKSNVHSLFALFLVPVWNWNLSKVWWKPVELTLSLLREEQTFHQNCESKHTITQIVCLPVLLCDDLFLLQHS